MAGRSGCNIGGRSSSSTTSRAVRCRNAPPPTSAATCCFGSTTVRQGASSCAGCTRWSTPSRAAHPVRDARATVAFTYHGLEAARRAAGVAGQLRAGVPAGHGGARGGARRRRRERAGELGTAARNARCARGDQRALAGRRAARRGAARARACARGSARRRGDLAAGLLPAGDRADVVRLQGRDRPAGDRGQRDRRHEPAPGSRSRPASSCSATRTRPASVPPMPTPDVLGRNGTYIVFRKLHTRVAAYRRYLREKAASRGGGGAARREDGGPLAERSAAVALPPTRTMPSSAPTARATTPSSTATIRAGSSARSARTHDARTHETRSTATAASTSVCTA